MSHTATCHVLHHFHPNPCLLCVDGLVILPLPLLSLSVWLCLFPPAVPLSHTLLSSNASPTCSLSKREAYCSPSPASSPTASAHTQRRDACVQGSEPPCCPWPWPFPPAYLWLHILSVSCSGHTHAHTQVRVGESELSSPVPVLPYFARWKVCFLKPLSLCRRGSLGSPGSQALCHTCRCRRLFFFFTFSTCRKLYDLNLLPI